DHHAMVEQKIHHPAVGPLDRGPEVNALSAPLVQRPAPLAQALRRVRHRARGDLRPARIHDPDGVRLIRPIHSKVIAHLSASFGALPSWSRSGNGEVGLIPALGGATFSCASAASLSFRLPPLLSRETILSCAPEDAR